MLIDLTHSFTDSMPVFPGDQASELKPVGDIFVGARHVVPLREPNGAVNYELRTGLHVGTHIDAPAHFIAGGKRISDFPVEKFVGRGVLLGGRDLPSVPSSLGGGAERIASSPPKEERVGRDFNSLSIRQGDIVLVHTGWSEKFRAADYYKNFPIIGEEFAQKLIDAKIKILVLDTPSPDVAPYGIHKLLLAHDILIIENATNLKALLAYKNFEIIALPMRIEAEASPVRVVAKITD